MRTGPWATLALSATCALLSGGLALLDGPATSAVSAAAAARPGELPSAPVRGSKADREVVRGFADVAFADRMLPGAELKPVALDPGTAFAADPVFGRLTVDGTLRPEIDSGLHDEILDDTEGLDDAIAALIAPAEAPDAGRVLPAVPVPPEKPAHAPLTNVPLPPVSPNAQRASLFAAATPPAAPVKPSRFAFFSQLGVAQRAETKLAALTPPPAPTKSRAPGIAVPTPFGVPYVLQTEKVDDSCLKPQLIELLRGIERHYGQKVVMTSGERAGGRDGSLHKTCRAADIIVPGVEAEALARYARTLPGMGGVGTYCHPNMIHVDIGSPRDWHYGCGKSYFALRDGSAGTAMSLAGRTRMTVTE